MFFNSGQMFLFLLLLFLYSGKKGLELSFRRNKIFHSLVSGTVPAMDHHKGGKFRALGIAISVSISLKPPLIKTLLYKFPENRLFYIQTV